MLKQKFWLLFILFSMENIWKPLFTTGKDRLLKAIELISRHFCCEIKRAVLYRFYLQM